MLRLYIDGQLADIEPSVGLSVGLSTAELTSLEWGRTTLIKGVKIPLTPQNQRLMGDSHNPLSAEMYNDSPHTAQVVYGGSVVAEGDIFLRRCCVGPKGYYQFDIVGSEREWVLASQAPIAQLGINFDTELTPEVVEESWTKSGAAVRFLPVERGLWNNIPLAERRLSLVDYHPFLHLHTLVESIFDQAGYSVVSKFLGTDWFRKLYISGAWSVSEDVDRWFEKNNFVALRNQESTPQQADHAGRVAANPLAHYNTVGNLVDATSSLESEMANGTFGVADDGRICFTPKSEVMVAFEYHLRYNTQTRVLSRERLQAFDTIHLDDNNEVVVPQQNRYSDQKNGTLIGGILHKLFIFAPTEGVTYHLRATRTIEGQSEQVELLTTTDRVTPLPVLNGAIYSNLTLIATEGIVEMESAADWAIYYGYIEEYNSRELEFTLISKPEVVTPQSPKFFDLLWFGGAEPGMSLTLHKGCSIRPIFLSMPQEGELLRWGDVAAVENSQFELLNSLRKLFDLEFYTDTLQVVYIEPRGELYNSNVVDLSSRIASDHGILISEIGSDSTRRIRVAYAKGDLVVEQLAEEEGRPYGSWTAHIENIYAPNTTTDVVAEMFTPSVAVEGSVGSAPSAKLIDVSGAAGVPERGVVRMNFAPKIVYYKGVVELPEGQLWPSMAEQGGSCYYPQAIFFEAPEDEYSSGVSLLIEERDGVVGLNRFWQHQVALLNRARRIELHLRLYADEVEALRVPNSLERDFRALYKLSVCGEEVLCRLEKVENYNPQEALAKCSFLTIV